MSWFEAFALTVAIELPIIVWLAGRGRRRHVWVDALAANLLTHPGAWWLVRGAGWSWIGVELAVAAVEALVYRSAARTSWRRAALMSCAANGTTAALSFVF